jgi:hypothetical protein
MTNNAPATLTDEEALHAFGKTYAALSMTGASEETLQSYVQDILKNKKPEPKISYQIFMRDSGREWGAGSRKPKFLTYGEAQKYLLDFYAPFTGDHNLALSSCIFDPNWWGNTYDIRKVTESN